MSKTNHNQEEEKRKNTSSRNTSTSPKKDSKDEPTKAEQNTKKDADPEAKRNIQSRNNKRKSPVVAKAREIRLQTKDGDKAPILPKKQHTPQKKHKNSNKPDHQHNPPVSAKKETTEQEDRSSTRGRNRPAADMPTKKTLVESNYRSPQTTKKETLVESNYRSPQNTKKETLSESNYRSPQTTKKEISEQEDRTSTRRVIRSKTVEIPNKPTPQDYKSTKETTVSTTTKSSVNVVKPEPAVFSVRVHQTVAVLIDGNNIEMSIHSMMHSKSAMLDFDKVIPRILEERGLNRLIYFREGLNISEKLAERLHKHYHGSVVPCHKSADIPLTITATQIAEKVDTIIIMSGDSDYIELVRHLKSRGVRVEIASVKATTAQILIDEADYAYDITKEDCFVFK